MENTGPQIKKTEVYLATDSRCVGKKTAKLKMWK